MEKADENKTFKDSSRCVIKGVDEQNLQELFALVAAKLAELDLQEQKIHIMDKYDTSARDVIRGLLNTRIGSSGAPLQNRPAILLHAVVRVLNRKPANATTTTKNQVLIDALFDLAAFCLIWIRHEQAKPTSTVAAQIMHQTRVFVERETGK